jgi:DNA-binding NarL/FixJ family response regulator
MFGWEAVTSTEWLVIDEVCAGRSNGAVADALGISRRTVEAHLRSIYAKVGVSTRMALATAWHDREGTPGNFPT